MLLDICIPVTQEAIEQAWLKLKHVLDTESDDAKIVAAWNTCRYLLREHPFVQPHLLRIHLSELRLAAVNEMLSFAADAPNTEDGDRGLMAIWLRQRELIGDGQSIQPILPRLDLAAKRLHALATLADANARNDYRSIVAFANKYRELMEGYQAHIPYQAWIDAANAQFESLQSYLNSLDEQQVSAKRESSARDRKSPPDYANKESVARLLKEVRHGVDPAELTRVAERLCRAIKQAPRNTELHAALGSIYSQQGYLAGAADHWQQVVAIDPHYADASRQLAGCLIQLGRHADAIGVLEQALRDPHQRSDARLYRSLCLAYSVEGRDDEALWALDQAQSIAFDAKFAALRHTWLTKRKM